MSTRRIALAVSALAAVTLAPASAQAAAVVAAPAIRAISGVPAPWTPSLLAPAGPGQVDQVRQLVPCGGKMYAVGQFAQITQGGTTYDRNQAFSFDATTGAVTSWDPNVTATMNPIVNSIALSADCSVAYLGGRFDHVGGLNATNIAAVDTTTGAFIPTFGHTSSGQVSALLMSGTHLLVGGYFTSINGSPKDYFVSLDPVTGTDDSYVNLDISGTYVFVNADGKPSSPNPTRVYNFTLSPDGTKLLATGVFTLVGGQTRRQIFMLNLGAITTVNQWYSAEFDKNCEYNVPFYLQDASWSPDGSRVYTVTTGYRPATGPGRPNNAPRTELCDSAAAFPSTAGLVSHLWVNYTGCDSLFSTAADSTTVFVAGHQRFLDDANHCSTNGADTVPGPGGVNAPGMAGLSPNNGKVSFNPTRGRGIGATDMLITPAGLWIASDNLENTNTCANVPGHAGICFLPYFIPRVQSDHSGDGIADKAVWRPSNGTWYVSGGATTKYGQSGDVPLSADFDGNGKIDIAVWRPSNGTWNINGFAGVPFGVATDKPVPADYTGDGHADFAVWRPSTGLWSVSGGPSGTLGVSTDVPVPADFTGDGKADFAVWRPSNGTFYVNGQAGGVQWGKSGDKPVVADFDGDARPDFAVWRPSNGTWYIRNLAGGTAFGASTDVPVAGDFTGDGKADIAVWRPSNGTWYVRNVSTTQWGANGDKPLRAAR